VCLWVLVLLFSSWSVWSCFVRFCVGFSFSCRLCFGGVFVPGPREVTEAFWNVCCATAVATGLTGAVHLSNQCSTGSKPCKFLFCVLVFFGSEGCLLVPRSSGTPVATWAWPTWVVSRRRVLEAVFILLESSSPSRRIFIGSHSLPPLWFAVSVLHLRRSSPSEPEMAAGSNKSAGEGTHPLFPYISSLYIHTRITCTQRQ
jgi:hypothetical protein